MAAIIEAERGLFVKVYTQGFINLFSLEGPIEVGGGQEVSLVYRPNVRQRVAVWVASRPDQTDVTMEGFGVLPRVQGAQLEEVNHPKEGAPPIGRFRLQGGVLELENLRVTHLA